MKFPLFSRMALAADVLAGEFDFTGVTCGKKEIARLGLGGRDVAKEAADVVLDPRRDFALAKVLLELGHRQIDEQVLGARLASHLPELLSVVGDDQRHCAIYSTADFLDLCEPVELAGLRRASQVEQGLPKLVEEFLMEGVAIHVPAFARNRGRKPQLRADVAPIDPPLAPAGLKQVGVIRVLEHDAHPEAQRACLHVERLLDEAFEFSRRVELAT